MKTLLASVSSGIPAMWPNREKRSAWTTAEKCVCPVARLTSSYNAVETKNSIVLWPTLI